MSKKEAISKARRMAKKRQCIYFVWHDEPGYYGYAIGDEYDADTFFAGSEPVYCTED